MLNLYHFLRSDYETPYNIDVYWFPHSLTFHYLQKIKHIFLTLELHFLRILIGSDNQEDQNVYANNLNICKVLEQFPTLKCLIHVSYYNSQSITKNNTLFQMFSLNLSRFHYSYVKGEKLYPTAESWRLNVLICMKVLVNPHQNY